MYTVQVWRSNQWVRLFTFPGPWYARWTQQFLEYKRGHVVRIVLE